MTVRTFFPQPPNRLPLVDDRREITPAWLIYFAGIVNQFARAVTVTASADPPSIPAAGFVQVSVTVPGAAVGSLARAAFSQAAASVVLAATVTAPETVTVTFQNLGASAVDLGAGVLRVEVIRA